MLIIIYGDNLFLIFTTENVSDVKDGKLIVLMIHQTLPNPSRAIPTALSFNINITIARATYVKRIIVIKFTRLHLLKQWNFPISMF